MNTHDKFVYIKDKSYNNKVIIIKVIILKNKKN
jgi:hypothetical protein